MRDRAYSFYQKRRAQVRESKSLDAAWRLVVLVVGATVVALGLFFFVFPGPGWPILWFGLVLLATEFAWAKRLLTPLTEMQTRVTRSIARRLSPRVRIASFVTIVVVVGVTAWLYLRQWGFTTHGIFVLRSWVRSKTPW